MTDAEALEGARIILGRQAFVRTGTGLGRCIVGRAEINVEGYRNQRVYGEAPTWPEALRKATAAYQAMVAEAKRQATLNEQRNTA
jgi:hypothetical protein